MGGSQPATSRPLRGREAELTRLTHLLDQVRAGSGCWLLIEGAAGTGKSALLDAFRTEAAARKVPVAATEADAAAPLGTLQRALAADQLGLSPGAGPGAEAGGVAAIRSVLDAIVRSHPLAVVIDDAAEADDASLRAIRELIAEAASCPVLWLLAARPGAKPAYRRLRSGRAGAGGLLRLSHLEEVHWPRIARDVLGADPDPDVLTLLGTTGGAVADILDLLDGGVRAGAFTVADGSARLDQRFAPRFFAESIAPALDGLPPPARRLMDIAAVLGPSFRISDLSALLGVSATRIAAEIRELCGAGLVGDGLDGELAFAHDLVRRTVLDRLPAAAHRAVSRDIALHLVAAGAPADDVAPYVLGGCRPAERPSPRLADALDRMAVVLPVGAYVRALDLAIVGSRHWLALAAPAARALAYGGRLPEAEAVLAVALAGDPSEAERAELRLVAAEAGWLQGWATTGWTINGWDKGQDHASEDLLGRPGRQADAADWIHRALGPAQVVAAQPTDVLAAVDAATQRTLPRDNRRLCAARLAGAEVLVRLGRMGDAVTYAMQSASSVRRVAGGPTVEPRIWLARALCGVDRLDEAQGQCEDVLCEVAQQGNVAMLPATHAVRARILLVRGHLLDAAAEAEAGVVAAEATAVAQASPELLAMLAFVAAVRGDQEVARRATERCAGLVRRGIVDGGQLALAYATAGPDLHATLPAVRMLVDELGTGFGPLVADPATAGLLARVLLAADDHRRVRLLRDAATRLAALNPRVIGWRAGQLYVEGLADHDSVALGAAARHFTTVGRHFAAAMALADAGRAGLRRGEPDAGSWLDEATRALRAMGAAAVVADLSRASAVDHGRRVRRPDRTAFGWNSLTGAELRVVMLAATGASNKEIAGQLWLSPHTVGTHIRHAMDKLGLRSRVEMARQAGERGIGPAAGIARELVLAYGSEGPR